MADPAPPGPVTPDASSEPAAVGGPPAPTRHLVLVAAVALVVIVVDQLTKAWVWDNLRFRTIDVVWTLRLHAVQNEGTAFSLGAGNTWTRWLPLLVLVVVAYLVVRGRVGSTKLGAVAVGLVVGGALGNIVDRAVRTGGAGFFSGGVIDFIDLQWWPVFNVADSCVVVGGIALVLISLWQEGRSSTTGG